MKCKDFILEAESSINAKSGKTTEIKSGSICTVDGGSKLKLKASKVSIN